MAEVIAARGEVTVVDAAGRRRALEQGDAVRRHDTLRTGPQARAKIRFEDGERLFLRAASRVRVRDWRLPETGPGTRVLELVRGGLRAISGAIGNRSGDTYRTVTPQTTLGIRGTDYVLQICGEDDCRVGGDAGGTLDAGLYVGVESGRVSLLNESGETAMAAGEVRYVAGPATPPTAVDAATRELLGIAAEREPASDEAEAQEKDEGGGWGWAVLGLILLGVGL